MTDYQAIFDKVEGTILSLGSQVLPAEQIRRSLDDYKRIEGKTFSDADYYRILVDATFYSGFAAATVSDHLDSIHSHFADYGEVAGYEDAQVDDICHDPEMIKNRAKVEACVKNARVFVEIVRRFGSFGKYVESFGATSLEPADAFGNLLLLKEDLECRFTRMGSVTSYHFLTDIGMPVLKPDRVICRIFKRLGLIDTEEHRLKAVVQGRKFAEATRYPIRHVDVVFVVYGQKKSPWVGLASGICLAKPHCSACGVREYCSFPAR